MKRKKEEIFVLVKRIVVIHQHKLISHIYYDTYGMQTT